MAVALPAEPAVPYPRAMARFPTLRQSWLGSFDACALTTKFDFEYRKGWSSHPQARGQIFHRFAGRALQEMVAVGEESIEVDVALAILFEVLRQDDVDRQCPECFSLNIRPGMTRNGLRTCGDCRRKFETERVNVPAHERKDLFWTVKKWAYDNAFTVSNLVAIEDRMWADLYYPNPHGGEVRRKLTGKIDALMVEEDHGTVLDWKDTWALPPPTEISHEGYFQQRFYGWLILRQPEYRELQSVTLREYYVRYSETRDATISREQLDDIELELAGLAERFDRSYEENAWAPTPGRHCNFCVRPSACPIPVFARDEGRITDPARAEQVAKSLIVAEKVVKDNRAALKSHTDIHGPIPVRGQKGGQVMGYQEIKRTSRPDKDALERAIREAGDVSRLDLDALYEERRGTRFGIHTPKPRDEAAEDAELLRRLEESVAAARADDSDDVPF